MNFPIVLTSFDCCWLIYQVAGPYGLPPTPARRALFVVYQTAIPYIAERIRLIIICFIYFLVFLGPLCFPIINMNELCLSNFMMTWLFVNSTVLELLRKALSLLTQSLLRVLVKMPTVAIVLRFLTPVFHPRRDNLLLLCQGWRGKWVHFGCIWFRDGLRYIN